MTPTTVCSSSLHSSTIRTLRGRPTLIGTTDMGRRTEVRSGRMAMVSGAAGSGEVLPGAPTGGAPSGGGGREVLAMSSERSTDLRDPHHKPTFLKPSPGVC